MGIDGSPGIARCCPERLWGGRSSKKSASYIDRSIADVAALSEGRSARGRNLISSLDLLRECPLFRLASLRLGWRIQLVNATIWLNISAGVWNAERLSRPLI